MILTSSYRSFSRELFSADRIGSGEWVISSLNWKAYRRRGWWSCPLSSQEAHFLEKLFGVTLEPGKPQILERASQLSEVRGGDLHLLYDPKYRRDFLLYRERSSHPNLPKSIDFFPLIPPANTEHETRPDEHMPEDFYMASRHGGKKAPRGDSYVIPLEWRHVTNMDFCRVTKDQARTISNFFGEKLGRLVIIDDPRDTLGIKPNYLALIRFQAGDYFIRLERREWGSQVDLPRELDLTKLVDIPTQDIGPNEMMPEDFYMASRISSNRDEKLVIPCHWRRLGAGTLAADITKDQAKTIANFFGAKLPRSVFYIPNINNFLGIGPNQIILTSLGGGRFVLNYREKSDQKLHPPDQIDLREAYIPQGDEMIPEDFYMASRKTGSLK